MDTFVKKGATPSEEHPCYQITENINSLLAELGAETVDAAIEAVRELKTKAAQGNSSPQPTVSEPTKLLKKLKEFASKIDSLNGTISSMESQLQSLYADRERLESEIGASEVEDVILAFGDLQTTISLMEKQLMTMYAGREVLEVELGRSDPQEIVAMFRTVTNLIAGAHQELEIPVK